MSDQKLLCYLGRDEETNELNYFDLNTILPNAQVIKAASILMKDRSDRTNAIDKINANEKLESEIDVSNPFISKDDYEVGQTLKVKTPEGEVEERRVFIPNDKDDFQPNLKYFVVDANAFFYYDAKNNRLIEVPN